MKTHELRTWPVYFRAIQQGLKTFEARKDDRGFKEGDALLLREYDPEEDSLPPGERYTGRDLLVQVTYVLNGGHFGIEQGWCVMGFRRVEEGS